MVVAVFGLLKKNNMLYSYAKLSKYDFGFVRFLGVGLGNLLFPWARSVIAADKYDLKLIEPTWLQVKIGPILRMEKDLRFYSDLFYKSPDAIGGFPKIYCLLTKQKFIEPPLLTSKPEIAKNFKDGIFEFSGLGNYFVDILKDHYFVRQKLLEISKDEHKAGLKYNFSNCVSLHIRRGDFKMEGWTTSADWFLWVMSELKRELGPDLKFKIFSDGSDEELASILKQENTERLSFGSALADLLALSQSRILVGSYNSTFSMWASYLGRMPTIWPEKGLSQPLQYEHPNNEVEVSLGTALPRIFIDNCQKMVKMGHPLEK